MRPKVDSDIYLSRINRVIDYIQENPAEDLSLRTLAKVAYFSPYHFHRLFTSLAGETLNAFVRRSRVERAARLLRASPHRTLSDVAPECGFASLATFSRAFKEEYGLSPGEWDRKLRLQKRKIEQAEGEFPIYSPEEFEEMVPLFPVEIVEVPAMRVAYVRTTNSYAEGAFQRTYDRLMEWVGRHELPEGIVFAMSYDDPDITPPEKCRLDVAYTLPDGMDEPDGVRFRTIPSMRVACAPCTGEFINIHKVWEFLYRYWLPRSRYEPRHLPAMERFRTQPADWWRDQVVDLEAWIPVKDLRRR